MYTTKEEILALDWKINPRGIRNKMGVYMICNKTTSEVVYIGQSKRVGERLCPSVHPVYRKELHDIYFMPTATKQKALDFETEFIGIIHPPRNRRTGQGGIISDEYKKALYRKLFG